LKRTSDQQKREKQQDRIDFLTYFFFTPTVVVITCLSAIVVGIGIGVNLPSLAYCFDLNPVCRIRFDLPERRW
jgi:hypothetical protein